MFRAISLSVEVVKEFTRSLKIYIKFSVGSRPTTRREKPSLMRTVCAEQQFRETETFSTTVEMLSSESTQVSSWSMT